MPSVQEDEEKAMEKLWPELQEHVNYLSDVYTLAFNIQNSISGMRIGDIRDLVRAQLMILMRITDFLRCIQLLAVKCYPEQAGTLAASVFELAHTAVLFSRSPDDAKEWALGQLHQAASAARSVRDELAGAGKSKLRALRRSWPRRSRIPGVRATLLDEAFVAKNAGYARGKRWRVFDIRATHRRARRKSRMVHNGACRAADGIRGLAADADAGNRGNEISTQGGHDKAPGIIQQSRCSIRQAESVRGDCTAEAQTASGWPFGLPMTRRKA